MSRFDVGFDVARAEFEVDEGKLCTIPEFRDEYKRVATNLISQKRMARSSQRIEFLFRAAENCRPEIGLNSLAEILNRPLSFARGRTIALLRV